MSILGIFTGNGLTKSVYESMKKEVDWEHNPPAGMILHSSAFDESDNTIHIADIWESEQDLNNFVNARLMPAMQKHNASVPNGKLYQIHTINVYQGIEKYRV